MAAMLAMLAGGFWSGRRLGVCWLAVWRAEDVAWAESRMAMMMIITGGRHDQIRLRPAPASRAVQGRAG